MFKIRFTKYNLIMDRWTPAGTFQIVANRLHTKIEICFKLMLRVLNVSAKDRANF